MRVRWLLNLALVGILLFTVTGVPVVSAQAVDQRYFAQSGFRVDGDAFWTYFQRRGAVRTFGYPTSRAFTLMGCQVQFFQRTVMQQCPGGGVQPLNLLDAGLLPYTRMNGSTFPAADPSFAAAGPAPSSADYATRLISFVREKAPDTFEGEPVRFFTTFSSTVTLADAFPGGGGDAGLLLLLNLEIWGLPTSAPQRDPANGNFIYQRFQRGVMHYDKSCGCTQGILLADYLKAVITGENLPGDLRAQAEGSPLYRQYAAGQPRGLARPSALPTSDFTNAFVKMEPVQATVPKPPKRAVFGYYVPYDTSSWFSLEANPKGIDYVAAQWAEVDACGNISSRDNQTVKQFARANGIKVLPSLLTSSAWLNSQLLNNPQTADNFLRQIVEYTVAEGYDGFDLDLEGVDPADRDALSAFNARVADALHAEGKLFTIAIPPKEREVFTGWPGAYDYAALGAAADLVTIMAYEWAGPFSGPGSVAPYRNVERVTAYATSQMPAEKVLLGLAFYGYDWNVTSGGTRAIGYAQAAALVERYGAPLAVDPTTVSATMRYSAPAGEAPPSRPALPPVQHTITSRQGPSCSVRPPFTPTTPGTRPTPPPNAIQDHVVWIEEATSAEARLGLVDRFGAGGVATWRLGLEEPRVWSVFADWRARP